MIAILGGLGAALCWATGTLCSSRATRLVGAPSTVAWQMLFSFAIVAPLAAVEGVPGGLDGESVAWMGIAGVASVIGLLLVFAALGIGKVSIVAPIASTEGAIAAVFAFLAGETIGVAAGVTLGVIACGIVLASIAPGGDSGDHLRAPLLATGAALCFGAGLYATGRLSDSVPLVWAIIPVRVVGVAAVALPLAVTRRLRLTRGALPLVVVASLCEVGGLAAYAIGARHSIAVSAVLASQFAALTAVAAYVLFAERITRLQVAGVTVIALGVAVLTALQA
jgi:drug/metabolite transporter (DMT)-like permease